MKLPSGRAFGPMVLAIVWSLATFTEAEVADTKDWIAYRNPWTGLSFHYPPNLRLQERDLSFAGGWPDVVEITDLIGDTPVNPRSLALRFTVTEGQNWAAAVSRAKARHMSEARAMRSGARQYSAVMRLDNRDALMDVSCGRAACHWMVVIVKPRQCEIVSGLGGADADDADPPLHDGQFPLRSIIETVHFDEPRSSRTGR